MLSAMLLYSIDKKQCIVINGPKLKQCPPKTKYTQTEMVWDIYNSQTSKNREFGRLTPPKPLRHEHKTTNPPPAMRNTMQRFPLLLLFFLTFFHPAFTQKTARVYGEVVDFVNHHPLPYATVKVQGSSYGAVCDSLGQFEISLPPGLYNIEASYVGYQALVKHEVNTSVAKPVSLLFELKEDRYALQTVEVLAEAYSQTSAAPLALQNISLHELQNRPGAVLDISRFAKTLPGFSPKVSFGYNLIVRGGAAFENGFYLDGIKLPAITHFTVQGTSGGPNGLINVLCLRKARLQTSAFSAERGESLSSVMELSSRKGRQDRFGGSLLLGATDWGFMLEGPMGKKSSYLFSARESFSQHAFKAIGIPVLPTYSDAQYHQHFQLNSENEIKVTALAAYDKYVLNLTADSSDALLYNTGYIPEGRQFLYAAGLVYTHYLQKSTYSFTLSRNHFFNFAEKYRNNTYLEEDLLRRYRSAETENRLELNYKSYPQNKEWSFGLLLNYRQVGMSDFAIHARSAAGPDTTDFDSQLQWLHYAFFASYAQQWDKRWKVYAGMRLEGNTYSDLTSNPIKQFSPRVSLAYSFGRAWQLSWHAGIYYQMPPAVLLAFRQTKSESSDPGPLINRDKLRYIQSRHAGMSIEHTSSRGYQLRLEGFYKQYLNYPLLLQDGISLANAQADYVVVGDQAADASSKGRAYGLEFQVRQKLHKSLFWNINFSWVVSQFTNADGRYVSSSWDNRYFGNLILGKRFGKNWQVGLHWVFSGGNPYTPYDEELSALKSVWDINQRGLFDYRRANSLRLPGFHQLNLRLDKQFDFKKWTLSLFLDLQNVYASPIPTLPYLTVRRDEQFAPLTNPQDPQRYLMQTIDNQTGRILPTLGIIADF